MRLESQALILSVRSHGEHGAIVRAFTPGDGVQAGYVRGGRSRRLKPILVPGNRVQAGFRARTDEQLAYLEVELVHSRAGLMTEALPAAGLEWACALSAATLPEGQSYPHLFEGLEGLLGAIEAAPSARGWAAALARYELLLLAELGFGLSRERLSLLDPSEGEWPSIHAALGVTGDRLARDLLTGRNALVLAARERLIDRLKRLGG